MSFGISVLDIASDLSTGTGSQETILMVQILCHTPIWVYALFFVLLAFGLMQTHTRTVGMIPALQLQVAPTKFFVRPEEAVYVA